jgi:pyruvate formate lyase activating enzyme
MAMTGRVHSIETLGAVDGPGLRCVVFLQGCPLRCQYCHNPDTWDCGGGTEMSVEEVVARVERSRPYFGKSGGVTLSGGEPLAQPEFAAEVLRRCQELGIHTAVDTSGACWNAAVEEALEYTDLVILDIKHADLAKYSQLTSGELERTLGFLEQVKRLGKPLWVRQVIVPGWNDTEDGARALAALLREVPSLERVELLPYHRMGSKKWEALGLKSTLEGVPEADADVVARLERMVRDEVDAAAKGRRPG